MTQSLPCNAAASMESTSRPVGVRLAETSRVAAGTPAAVSACLICSASGFGLPEATTPSVSDIVFCNLAVDVPAVAAPPDAWPAVAEGAGEAWVDRGGLAAADGPAGWPLAPAVPRPGCWAVPELHAAMAASRSAVSVIRTDAPTDVLLDVLTNALRDALLQEPASLVVD
jgi:hypothetical protein